MAFLWYALETKPLAEAAVCQAILDLPGEYKPLLPLRDTIDEGQRAHRIAPRFPGYVFAGFDDERFGWSHLRYIVGVKHLLGGSAMNDYHPTPLPRGYVDELLAEQVEFRSAPAAIAMRRFKAGERLNVAVGLTTVEVIVSADRGEKIAVWIDMMGGRRRTIVRRESLVGAFH